MTVITFLGSHTVDNKPTAPAHPYPLSPARFAGAGAAHAGSAEQNSQPQVQGWEMGSLPAEIILCISLPVFAPSPAVEFSSTFLFRKDSPTKLSKALSDGRDQLILVKIDLFEHRVLLFFLHLNCQVMP